MLAGVQCTVIFGIPVVTTTSSMYPGSILCLQHAMHASDMVRLWLHAHIIQSHYLRPSTLPVLAAALVCRGAKVGISAQTSAINSCKLLGQSSLTVCRPVTGSALSGALSGSVRSYVPAQELT